MKDPSPPAAWREATIHAAYVRIAINLAQTLGLDAGIRNPEASRMVPLLDVVPLLKALGVENNPYLGIHLGKLVPASAHGALGYAVVSSATVGQAMDTLSRYVGMRNRLFNFRFSKKDGESSLIVTPRIHLGPYRTFTEIASALSVFKMVQGIAGDSAAAEMIMETSWENATDMQIPMQVRSQCQRTTLRVPAHIAERASHTADPKLYVIACRGCEEELAALDGNISARLRAMLPDVNQQWPTLKQAAAHFAMSPRTLIRRLVTEGLTYQALLDEAKGELACWYLSNTSLPIGIIASKLGFLDDANFSRSFKRWTQRSPSAYRKEYTSKSVTQA